MNRITFTYYATSIPRYDLRVVLRVPGEPTQTLFKILEIAKNVADHSRTFGKRETVLVVELTVGEAFQGS
jgi:hypothetical protein